LSTSTSWIIRGREENREREWERRYPVSFGEPSPQRHTGTGGTHDKLPSLVKDVAFDEAHDFGGPNHSRFRAKLASGRAVES
jgi:hypothetical protein